MPTEDHEKQLPKWKAWLLFLLLNLAYGGIVLGVYALSQALGIPWLFNSLWGLIIIVGLICTAVTIYWSVKKWHRKKKGA